MFVDRQKHWPHLKQQHGRIGEHKADYLGWCDAYEESMASIYDNIRDYLPENIEKVLDIGGGFSGISALIAQRKGQFDLTVIDGLNDIPKRGKTYNSADLGIDFLRENHFMGDVSYIEPGKAAVATIRDQFDVILSFAAYPFHIAPTEYAFALKSWARPDTVIILEARRGWEEISGLVKKKTIFSEEKYERNIYALA